MHTTWKKLCTVVLACAVAMPSLRAQTNSTNDNSTNVAVAPAAPTPPSPPDSTSMTNSAAVPKKAKPQPAAPSVRIGPDGVFVGVPYPVSVRMPNGGYRELGDKEAVLILVAIITPFVSLIIICLMFFYFRHRRNRMLHETLRAMIEKGVPIPPELLGPPQAMQPLGRLATFRKLDDFRKAMIFLAIGLVMIVCIPPIGMIFLLLGGAFLLFWKLDKKNAITNEAAPK